MSRSDDWLPPHVAIARLQGVGLSAFVDGPKVRYTNGTASRSGSLSIHPNGCVDGAAVGRIINYEP